MNVMWCDDQLFIDIDSVIKVVKDFTDTPGDIPISEEYLLGMRVVADSLESVKFEYTMRERLKE